MTQEVDHPVKDGEKKHMAPASECRGCGHPVSGAWCGYCGLRAAPPEESTRSWPGVGEIIEGGRESITLKRALKHGSEERRFLADGQEGRRYEVVITAADAVQALRRRRAEARALLGDAALSPAWVADWADCRCVVTALPEGTLLGEAIERMSESSDAVVYAQAVRTWALPVINFLAQLHDQGLFLGAVDPDEVLITPQDRCVLLDIPVPLDIADGPFHPEAQPVSPGFSAPEVVGHCGGVITPATDVFFAGMVLYYLVTGVERFEETVWPSERLPNPNIYRLDVSPDLVAVIRRATSPVPSRRYPDALALRTALAWALHQEEKRSTLPFQRLKLEIGHELHIGVLKGQYNPQNQDDMFLAWDHLTGVGLFLIADGVSISEYGTGDLASACVREEAFNLWSRLRSGRVESPKAADRENVESTGLIFEPGPYSRPGLPLNPKGRRAIMRQMLDQANARIGERVHQDMPTFPAQPMGIMASTAVAALVDGNAVTLMSIGDSRIYLIRDGHITSLMADHDLATQLLRFGRTPSTVRQVAGGGALVRCVGEFEKNDRDRLVPVPLQPDFRELRVLPGDTIVLCSDGIPDYAGLDEEDAEDRMRQIVESAPGATWAAFELMVLANRGAGGDNISCVVLSFGSPLPMGDATPLSIPRKGRGK
ncbi:MAG: protein phosphatase 2C domain-containing protein [Bradymonadia bacterium]